MLDRFSIKVIRSPLAITAAGLDKLGVTANQTTLSGFLLGCLAFPALYFEQYEPALVFIVINRVFDCLLYTSPSPRDED